MIPLEASESRAELPRAPDIPIKAPKGSKHASCGLGTRTLAERRRQERCSAAVQGVRASVNARM
eukprot:4443014-Alexandrium_andersonii.AAC.1